MYKLYDLKVKKVLSRLTFLCYFFIFLIAFACSSPNGDKQEKVEQDLSAQNLSKTVIPVEGMTCNACVASIKKKLNSMEGLKKVEVSLQNRNATVLYEEGKLSPQQIRDAINGLGYKAGEPITEKDGE